MKLAALYLSDHAYLNNEFDMINFGGRYHYSLSAALPLTITRRPNEQFIDRFFDVSESKISLENVSAIVGQNGVGKSTLLDAIRRNFIENTYALPRASSFLLIEDGETVFYYSAEEFDLSLLNPILNIEISIQLPFAHKMRGVQILAEALVIKTNFNIKRTIHFLVVFEYFGANCSHRFTNCATRAVTQL